MALYSFHSYAILCADTFMIDPERIDYWDLANTWEPARLGYCYKTVREPVKFSLAGMVKAQKEQREIERELPILVEQAPLIVSKPRFSLAAYSKTKQGKAI